MIKLQEEQIWHLGYEWVYPSTEQHLRSMYFALDIAGFGGFVSHQQGEPTFSLRSWYLRTSSPAMEGAGEEFSNWMEDQNRQKELGIHKEQRED